MSQEALEERRSIDELARAVGERALAELCVEADWEQRVIRDADSWRPNAAPPPNVERLFGLSPDYNHKYVEDEFPQSA